MLQAVARCTNATGQYPASHGLHASQSSVVPLIIIIIYCKDFDSIHLIIIIIWSSLLYRQRSLPLCVSCVNKCRNKLPGIFIYTFQTNELFVICHTEIIIIIILSILIHYDIVMKTNNLLDHID